MILTTSLPSKTFAAKHYNDAVAAAVRARMKRTLVTPAILPGLVGLDVDDLSASLSGDRPFMPHEIDGIAKAFGNEGTTHLGAPDPA